MVARGNLWRGVCSCRRGICQLCDRIFDAGGRVFQACQRVHHIGVRLSDRFTGRDIHDRQNQTDYRNDDRQVAI